MTESPHLFGGYGEYVYLMPGSSVLKIDSQLGEEKAILAVAGGHAVVHGLEKMEGGGFRAGDMVVVQGAGPIGLAGLIQAKVGGAKKIIMIGAPKSRLSIAKEIGADDVIDIEEVPDPDERVELVREMTNENGAELVIEASGGQTALDEGLRMASVGGKYLVIGQSDNQNRAINPSSIIRKQLKIYGTMGGTINNDYKAMQALSKFGALPMDKIITHRFQVEEATDALRCMERLEPMIAVIDHR
jgi:threonine dehydrogenase-like Zn-dependent dehydrogenase